MFYFPKLFFGALLFVTSIVILTYQFPGVGNDHPLHSPVEAITNWSDYSKDTFIGFSFTYIVLLLVWSITWFVGLYLANKKLNNLPYMSTRYIQLSYRFFSLQATLVTLYYFAQCVTTVLEQQFCLKRYCCN